jgi:hypothetical protein
MIVIASLAVEKLIVSVYNVEPLNSVDLNTFYDQTSNRCNIMAALLFDHCDESVLRDVF